MLRALCAFCVIAALGWPLWHLTHAMDADAPAQVVAPQAEAKAIGLQLDFTTPPRRFVVRHLEKDVWTQDRPPASLERSLPVVYPAEGVEFVFSRFTEK